MTCAQHEELCMALVALAADDPERLAAEAHAQTCPGCDAALARARDVLAEFTELAAPTVPPAALRRAARPIRRDLLRRSRPRGVSAIAAVLGGLIVAGAVREHAAHPSVVLAVLAAAAAIVTAAVLPLVRGIAAGFAVLASAALVAALGRHGVVDPAIGFKCAPLELLAAALPYVTTLLLIRRRGGAVSPSYLAAVAAAGALAGQAALHLSCPDQDSAPHLIIFHFGGVVFAAALGWLIARFARPRPASGLVHTHG